MNLLSMFRTKEPAEVIAGLEQKLNDARGNLAALKQRRAEVALTADLDQGSEPQLTSLVAEIGTAQDRLTNLIAACGLAREQQVRANKMKAEAEHKAKVDRYKGKLADRGRAGEKLRIAIANYADAYESFVDASEEAWKAHPDGALPMDAGFDRHGIWTAVSDELARLTPNVRLGDGERDRLPGANRVGQVYRQDDIPEFFNRVFDANERELAKLEANLKGRKQ